LLADRFDFLWEAPDRGDGFELKMADPGGWLLIEAPAETSLSQEPVFVLARREGAAFRTYKPLKELSALYRNFAETPGTPEGVLAFANQYGMLFREAKRKRYLSPAQRDVLAPFGDNFRRAECVELVDDWVRQIRFAAETVELWGMATNQENDKLRRKIRWEGRRAVHYVPTRADVFEYVSGDTLSEMLSAPAVTDPESRFLIASAEKNPEAFSKLEPGERVRPALLRVIEHVNRELPGHTAPGLFWNHQADQIVFQEMPLSLLGAIYLQLAHAVARNRSSRRCEVCSRWFELDPAKTRVDRRTCSNTCRTKSYRNRQYRARDLHAQGKTLREIARAVGSNVTTVKNWIKEQ
jgi:hypothetical protein